MWPGVPRLPPKSNRTFGRTPWPPCPVFIVICTLIDLIIVPHCSATFTFIGYALSLKCSLGTRWQAYRTPNLTATEFKVCSVASVTCHDLATWVVLKLFKTTTIVRALRGSHKVTVMQWFYVESFRYSKIKRGGQKHGQKYCRTLAAAVARQVMWP